MRNFIISTICGLIITIIIGVLAIGSYVIAAATIKAIGIYWAFAAYLILTFILVTAIILIARRILWMCRGNKRYNHKRHHRY